MVALRRHVYSVLCDIPGLPFVIQQIFQNVLLTLSVIKFTSGKWALYFVSKLAVSSTWTYSWPSFILLSHSFRPTIHWTGIAPGVHAVVCCIFLLWMGFCATWLRLWPASIMTSRSTFCTVISTCLNHQGWVLWFLSASGHWFHLFCYERVCATCHLLLGIRSYFPYSDFGER